MVGLAKAVARFLLRQPGPIANSNRNSIGERCSGQFPILTIHREATTDEKYW